MRDLHNLIQQKIYDRVAEKMEKKVKPSTSQAMVPVAHAMFIMSFSLMYTTMAMYDSLQNYFLGYGYCVYAGMMLFVLLAYALRNKKQGFDFWQSLMCAFVMFGMGVLTLFLSLMLLISVIILLDGISEFFRKIFDKNK